MPTMASPGRSERDTQHSDEASNVSTTTVTSKTTTTTRTTSHPIATPEPNPDPTASGSVRRSPPTTLYFVTESDLLRGAQVAAELAAGDLNIDESGQVQPAYPAYPPRASTSGKRYYVFRRDHNLGPVVACGWDLGKALWVSGRAPEGFRGLEEAVASCFQHHSDCSEVRIRRS